MKSSHFYLLFIFDFYFLSFLFAVSILNYLILIFFFYSLTWFARELNPQTKHFKMINIPDFYQKDNWKLWKLSPLSHSHCQQNKIVHYYIAEGKIIFSYSKIRCEGYSPVTVGLIKYACSSSSSIPKTIWLIPNFLVEIAQKRHDFINT